MLHGKQIRQAFLKACNHASRKACLIANNHDCTFAGNLKNQQVSHPAYKAANGKA